MYRETLNQSSRLRPLGPEQHYGNLYVHVAVCPLIKSSVANLDYEAHLESSWHGIITPQCIDKVLSNNTF